MERRGNTMNYQDEKEFASLSDCFCKLTPRNRVLEIGSMHGETLTQWMNNMSPKEGKIISIDLLVPESDSRYWQQKYGHEVMWPKIAYTNGIQLYCLNANSRDPRVIEFVKSELPEIDFLFIDGGHDYETCMADWNHYSSLVRWGGIVAFHDLGKEWPDVRTVWERVRSGHNSMEFVQSSERWGIGVLYM